MNKNGLAARYMFFAVIFAAGLFLAPTLRHASAHTVNLTEDDSGKSISISTGTTIILKLSDKGAGGYRLDSVQYNQAVIQLQKHTTNPAESNKLGAQGTSTWRFVAIASGRSELKVTATRPWKGGGTVTVFDGIVMVKKSGN